MLDDIRGEFGDGKLRIVGDSRGFPGGELANNYSAQAGQGSWFGLKREDAVATEGVASGVGHGHVDPFATGIIT
jgi:hypothetical protein